jgi:hypothetical protein
MMTFDSSVQTIAWIRDRYREGNLKIKPPFQRKPVWVARQKCYLIESILRGLPVPEIYIQQTTSPEGETTYAVVDGQQRIRTVLQFVGSEEDPEEAAYNKFTLDKLEPNSDWANVSFAELTAEQKKSFYGYKFAVRYLNTDSDDEVRDMFRRLNKFLTPLKPQELRNATYAGPFVTLVQHLADNEYWAENRIVTPAAIRRMNDVEYVSELMIGVLHGPQGGSAAIVDSYYQQYEDYEDVFPDQKRMQRVFDNTLAIIQTVFPDIKDKRWSNKTDFYTLFVAIASILRTARGSGASKLAYKTPAIRKALDAFAASVDWRLGNENAPVTTEVIEYVRAVEKGANDKARRAERNRIITRLIEKHFTMKDTKPPAAG